MNKREQSTKARIQILRTMKRLGIANKKVLKELKELEMAKGLIPKPLEGTPYIEDIGEFVDSATEEGD